MTRRFEVNVLADVGAESLESLKHS